MKTTIRRTAVTLLFLAIGQAARGEVLDSIGEYGNAAGANLTSGAGIDRGFTNPASGEYTITAGGTDFWGPSDHGSFIYDADGTRAAGENFSAVVRSVSIGANPAEILATEWGRTGPMARVDPVAANFANVAHIRKHGTLANGFTTMQWRDSVGANTDRTGSEHGNQAANLVNGDVRTTPIWLALHRFDGVWYSTWADDAAGSPGTWSESRQHNASAASAGEVYVGLCHQSHNINPEVNTAHFEQFEVGAFDNDLGDFPASPTGSITADFGTGEVRVTASSSEVGDIGGSENVDWRVEFIGADGVVPGGIAVDLWVNQNNGGNRGAFDTLTQNTAPSGSTIIETIRWAASNYIETNAGGVNLFAQAVPGSFTGNEDQYAANTHGEIFIPSDVSRDGVESVRFHDGVDDYCLLVVDNVTLIDHNGWSNLAGTGNNGGTQGTLNVSDPKFDDGEWVAFQLGTWEGGGGDDAVINWDALDRTGSDDVTLATDAVLNSYNPADLPDALQVSFAHDRSDEIPSANFRTLQPAIIDEESGSGQPAEQLLTTPIPAGTLQIHFFVGGNLLRALIPNGDADDDDDNLTNQEEFDLGTDPNDDDTDNDLLKDGEEVAFGTDPLDADSDDDLLTDKEEQDAGTNPLLADTDDDGVIDSAEITKGTNPLVADEGNDFGLVSYWPLDTDYNDAIDDNHGTATPAAIPFATGKFDNATHLDGASFIEITGGDESEFDFTNGGFTVSAWCTIDAIDTNWQCLIAKGEGAGWRMHRRGADDPPEMAFTGGNGDVPRYNTALTIAADPEVWHHFVGTTDARTGDQVLYMDGVEVSRSGGALLENRANRMRIGDNPDANGRLWKGKVDDVGIWCRPLSAADVGSLWNGGEGLSVDEFINGSIPLQMTEVAYDQGNEQFTLTWTSKPNRSYGLFWSIDGADWDADIDDGIDSEGDTTTFGPFANPDPGASVLLFRAEQN